MEKEVGLTAYELSLIHSCLMDELEYIDDYLSRFYSDRFLKRIYIKRKDVLEKLLEKIS